MFCLKREAATLNRFPGLSLLRLSGMSALASCFFHCRLPSSATGAHLTRDQDMWPWSPDSLAHKSSWSTCSSSVSGCPASPLDVLFPHIRQTTLKPPRAIRNSDGPYPISGSSSVLSCIIACQAQALPPWDLSSEWIDSHITTMASCHQGTFSELVLFTQRDLLQSSLYYPGSRWR